MARPDKATIDAILAHGPALVRNAAVLKERDPHDYYWRDLTDPGKLLRNGVLLETNMVTAWIAATRRPRRILEIGTRSGGSLIALLSAYPREELVHVQRILSFDLWREYMSTTTVASWFSRWLRLPVNMNMGMINRWLPGVIAGRAEQKIKANLRAFDLPVEGLEFVAGDSKITVPAYFNRHGHELFDYILVDGGHDEHTASVDLENVWALCAPGGVILFDDIMPESYGLMGVWEAFKAKHGKDFSFFEIEHRKGVAWALRHDGPSAS